MSDTNVSKKGVKTDDEEHNDAIDAIVVDSEHEHEMDDKADGNAGNEQVANDSMGDADNDDANDTNDSNDANEANDGDDADVAGGDGKDAIDAAASRGADGTGNEMDEMSEDGDADEKEANDENDQNVGNEGSEQGNEQESEKMDENETNDENDENNESGAESKKSVAKRVKKGKGKSKQNDNGYRVYLFKILKQVHPKIGITKIAMDIINSFIEDMFEKICSEAMKLCAYNKTSTIGAREIATATKLILPGELQKHALLEGEKAVQKFESKSKVLHAKREKARGGKKGVFPGRKK